MRGKGFGQKLDKYWRAFSKWCDKDYAYRMANKRELQLIMYDVDRYFPQSEWEVMDKNNLLDQILFNLHNEDW